MTEHFPQLLERARSQALAQPNLYGWLDVERSPLRFTTDPAVPSGLPAWVADRDPILDDPQLVELVRTTTMLGDVDADPYAALLPEHGLRKLVAMVQTAARSGLDAVPDAPPELHRFISAMEDAPDWLDMDLVEQGARQARVGAALTSPFIIRGAFIATFLNTYSALPMALTGALSGRRAAHRINETANFFAVTTLPGALDRHGIGFEAAAMVRLMHSIVRYNALTRSDQWDVETYGVPVPQIDQMPAGLINVYLLSAIARWRGREEFTATERAVLEFSRYRCFLLGLPEELLPPTPEGIIRVFHGRAACLRDDFDETCRALVRSTMAAYLRPDDTWFERAADAVERTWSKAFVLGVCGGSRRSAEAMGVRFEIGDPLRLAASAPFILGRFVALQVASSHAWLPRWTDDYLVRTVEKRLAAYGNPEFTTDPDSYDGQPASERRRRSASS